MAEKEDKKMLITLSPTLNASLNFISNRLGMDASHIIRWSLTEFFDKHLTEEEKKWLKEFYGMGGRPTTADARRFRCETEKILEERENKKNVKKK